MRRSTIFLLLLLGCSPAMPVDPAKPVAARPGTDWPRFLGPTGDNVSTETGILKIWPKEGLKKRWDCPLGTGYAPPAVAAGRLIHFDKFEKTNRATCRNAETGEQLWTYSYPNTFADLYNYDGCRCGPVIDDDRVYLYGPEGMLACVNAGTGKEIWTVDTHAKYHVHQNFFGVSSSPVIEGDLLVVAVGGSPKGPRPFDLRDAKPNGTALVAFDKRTGAVKYEAGDELASFTTPVIATINGQRMGLYHARGGLLGFEPATGKTLFHYPWRAKIEESAIAATPMVAGDAVLISESYELGSVLLDLASGRPREVWTDKGKDREEKALLAHWNTPIHHEGFAYASSGRHTTEGDIRCINLKTGGVAWIEKKTMRCTLMKVDGHLLCLSEGGELRLINLDAAKYAEAARWESPDLAYPAWAPPVLSRGLLYLRGKDRLACYELIPNK